MTVLTTTLMTNTLWSQQTLIKMSLEEKVGQLFVAPACPNREAKHLSDLCYLIDHYHIGGVLLKAGAPKEQVELINLIYSPIPLLRFADAEWGVSMRLNDSIKFPYNLTLGAIQNTDLLVKFGEQVGWECNQVGIDINLAPVVDVNTNPLNPVIGRRSFGEKAFDVSNKASAMIRGMQKTGTWASIKHFPGHGETSVDSHHELPQIQKLELRPFLDSIKEGARCVTTAHLKYEEEIVTFSSKIVQGILRDKWQFQGLITTDALNMGALTKYYSTEEIAVKALLAGHDILLYGDDRKEVVDKLIQQTIPQAIEAIISLVKSGKLSEEDLNTRVLRILQAKKEKGLRNRFNVPSSLITKSGLDLKKELFNNAVTLVSNQHLPLKDKAYSIVAFGATNNFFQISCDKLLLSAGNSQITLVAIYEITQEVLTFLECQKKEGKPYVVILFMNPYKVYELEEHLTLLVAYEDELEAAQAAAAIIFGKQAPLGKRPLSLPTPIAPKE